MIHMVEKSPSQRSPLPGLLLDPGYRQRHHDRLLLGPCLQLARALPLQPAIEAWRL